MFTNIEISSIAKSINPKFDVLDYKIKNASDKLVGYLGEHLILELRLKDQSENWKCFIKCVPRSDPDKADYIRKCKFFQKEYGMLRFLFKSYGGDEDIKKWRPKVLFLKEDVFVFENMPSLGYIMPDQVKCLSFDEIKCVVEAVALFHASSYIYEEEKGAAKGKEYRINEDFKEYLQEPTEGHQWRNTGMKAIVDTLSVLSPHKNKTNFREILKNKVTKLDKEAIELMKPNSKYRNVVVHRDLWSNNIFLKYENSRAIHAVIVDFQTVLYASPLLDLSSLLYFNTDSAFRKMHTIELLNHYYEHLSDRLNSSGIDVGHIIRKDTLFEAYEESIIFGLSQAALIVPLIATNDQLVDKYFNDPSKYNKINMVSRSEEILEIASIDDVYRKRIMELFEELFERYLLF